MDGYECSGELYCIRTGKCDFCHEMIMLYMELRTLWGSPVYFVCGFSFVNM